MNRLGTYPTGPGITWSFRNKLSRRRRLPIWTLLWLTHHEKGQQKSLKLQSSKDLLELFKFTKVMSFLELRRKLKFFEAVEVLKNKKHFIILSFCYSHRNSNNTPPKICTQWLRKLYSDFSDLGGKLLSPLRFVNLMTSSYDLRCLSVPCFALLCVVIST